MKLFLIPVLLFSVAANSQTVNLSPESLKSDNKTSSVSNTIDPTAPAEIKLPLNQRWRIDKNKILTGGLLFTAGFAKGFNEALQYKYNGFEEWFPHADDQWFYPTFSYTNKYKDHDPSKGARFPLSTSALVMFTDQYHLNNFIQKSALTAALVLKIGEGKRPFKHYVFDLLYYTACYQAGFHAIYQPISARN